MSDYITDANKCIPVTVSKYEWKRALSSTYVYNLYTSLLAKHNVKNGFRDRLHNIMFIYYTALDSVSSTHLSLYMHPH